MRCVTKVGIGVAAAVVLAVFFMAPIVYQETAACSPLVCSTNAPRYQVYQSFGCATIGVGTVYSPYWFGLSFGCNPSEHPFPAGGPSQPY
ncbi:MAG: hypothetical protein JRN21_02390 [Nitrososphaerota archaeon]|nr:hypothetical protein [Nitrososphaerota archaeon]